MLLKKALLRFSFLLSILFLTACTFYNTLQISTGEESIGSNIRLGKIVVIHDLSEQNEFVLSSVVIENDSLKGKIHLPPAGRKHKAHRTTFGKKRAEAYPEPLLVMHIYTLTKDIKPGPFGIPIDEIKVAEIHEKNVGAGILATTALVSLITVAGSAAILAIACNCPQVTSYNANGTQFHGALFPGAIFKSLKRDDYLVLNQPVFTGQGDLKLRVSNEMPETQYIDQLEVLQVEHEGYAHLGLNDKNKLVAYNDPISPEQAMAGPSKDITNTLKQQDELNYDFDYFTDFEQLNELTLKFNKSNFSKNPALLIHGQQTQWLDTVANYIFYEAGRHKDKWEKRKDNSSAQKWKNTNIKRGLSLNVYLKVNEDWEYIGTHHDVGTTSKRDLLMEIDLKKVQSPFIEIKLESAFKIWEVDFVGLADDWNDELNTKSLDLLAAHTHLGDDVSQNINLTDEHYLIQEELGSYVDLHLEAPAKSSASTIVLHGAGYYHRHSDFDDKMNLSFFMKLKRKTGFQDVSRALYQYKNIKLHSNTDDSATVSN